MLWHYEWCFCSVHKLIQYFEFLPVYQITAPDCTPSLHRKLSGQCSPTWMSGCAREDVLLTKNWIWWCSKESDRRRWLSRDKPAYSSCHPVPPLMCRNPDWCSATPALETSYIGYFRRTTRTCWSWCGKAVEGAWKRPSRLLPVGWKQTFRNSPRLSRLALRLSLVFYPSILPIPRLVFL